MIVDTPTQTVLYSLEQAIKAYRKLCQRNISQVMADLTVDQGLALMVLNQHPTLNQHEIAELVFKDKASITRIIELLVQKGFVDRAMHATDRRKFELRITAKGRDTIAQLGGTIQLNQQTALAGLPDEELARFYATLQKIIANCSVPV
ncbi:MarR family winged helix-turn-helix transcriptional regulator [Hymenobacter sp. IS2118]|uniref:MarR family winged helix-turn-helix transcriptional regulator n=1 Tax=Hymenobacter sp. IS2118 TaxID=1505605 RepID=UPI0005545EC6|nr:MarR family transcriptional regulator [Hymenobacter sp. IS2118]